MKWKIHISIYLSLLSFQLWAQHPDKDLAFHADVFSNAYQYEHRLRALDSFNDALGQWLSRDSSFDRSLEFLPWLSAVYAPDSSFRLITWQIEDDSSRYRYFGKLQHADGRIITLSDRAGKNNPLEYEALTPNEWYGAKYYQIVSYNLPAGEEAYLLLGYDAWSETDRRRVAEIMMLDSTEVTFGLPAFGQPDDDIARTGKYRLIVQYAANARFMMQYDPERQMLLIDHLIPVRNPITGSGTSMVPDGSYIGYSLQDGHWVRTDKVFDQVLDKPPVNKPEGAGDRDLFGLPEDKEN